MAPGIGAIERRESQGRRIRGLLLPPRTIADDAGLLHPDQHGVEHRRRDHGREGVFDGAHRRHGLPRRPIGLERRFQWIFGQPISAPTTSGAVAGFVAAGSPAAKAGLVVGDVITLLGGQTVVRSSSLTTILTREKPGSSVRLVYVDPSNTTRTVTVHLAAGPPQ